MIKLSSLGSYLRKTILPATIAVASVLPLKVSNCHLKFAPPVDIFKKELSMTSKVLNETVLDGLRIVSDTNFRGGITQRFSDISVFKLKERILRQDSLIDFCFPIRNEKDVYLEPCGMYFARRPDGKNARPHLGLDVFVTRFARKPKEPVAVVSPLEGVVISQKRARKKDNVIANSITILGVDGRRYAFDHLARGSDYKDSISLPSVGSILKKGDSIGYVGRTGETALWHLHMSVMTDEMLLKQKNEKFWQDLSVQTPYAPLKGQVDPLDLQSAGPIAELLNKYRR